MSPGQVGLNETRLGPAHMRRGRYDGRGVRAEVQEDKETERIEAFSDGVFGIAMTLLVLEIKVPSHEAVAAKGLVYSLAALWPSYLAFGTSFATRVCGSMRRSWTPRAAYWTFDFTDCSSRCSGHEHRGG